MTIFRNIILANFFLVFKAKKLNQKRPRDREANYETRICFSRETRRKGKEIPSHLTL